MKRNYWVKAMIAGALAGLDWGAYEKDGGFWAAITALWLILLGVYLTLAIQQDIKDES